MPDLNFQVEGAEPVAHAAAPLLAFKLRVTNADAQQHIHNIMLECQIRIEPTRRALPGGRTGTTARLVRRASALERYHAEYALDACPRDRSAVRGEYAR